MGYKNKEDKKKRDKEYYEENKEKIIIQNKNRYQKTKHLRKEYTKLNITKIKIAAREYRLRSEFGISIEEYNTLLEKQKFVCAICAQPETAIFRKSGITKSLAVDHCHNTGKVRGLLCQACNLSIGHMQDNIKRLREAANYLERFHND